MASTDIMQLTSKPSSHISREQRFGETLGNNIVQQIEAARHNKEQQNVEDELIIRLKWYPGNGYRPRKLQQLSIDKFQKYANTLTNEKNTKDYHFQLYLTLMWEVTKGEFTFAQQARSIFDLLSKLDATTPHEPTYRTYYTCALNYALEWAITNCKDHFIRTINLTNLLMSIFIKLLHPDNTFIPLPRMHSNFSYGDLDILPIKIFCNTLFKLKERAHEYFEAHRAEFIPQEQSMIQRIFTDMYLLYTFTTQQTQLLQLEATDLPCCEPEPHAVQDKSEAPAIFASLEQLNTSEALNAESIEDFITQFLTPEALLPLSSQQRNTLFSKLIMLIDENIHADEVSKNTLSEDALGQFLNADIPREDALLLTTLLRKKLLPPCDPISITSGNTQLPWFQIHSYKEDDYDIDSYQTLVTQTHQYTDSKCNGSINYLRYYLLMKSAAKLTQIFDTQIQKSKIVQDDVSLEQLVNISITLKTITNTLVSFLYRDKVDFPNHIYTHDHYVNPLKKESSQIAQTLSLAMDKLPKPKKKATNRKQEKAAKKETEPLSTAAQKLLDEIDAEKKQRIDNQKEKAQKRHLERQRIEQQRQQAAKEKATKKEAERLLEEERKQEKAAKNGEQHRLEEKKKQVNPVKKRKKRRPAKVKKAQDGAKPLAEEKKASIDEAKHLAEEQQQIFFMQRREKELTHLLELVSGGFISVDIFNIQFGYPFEGYAFELLYDALENHFQYTQHNAPYDPLVTTCKDLFSNGTPLALENIKYDETSLDYKLFKGSIKAKEHLLLLNDKNYSYLGGRALCPYKLFMYMTSTIKITEQWLQQCRSPRSSRVSQPPKPEIDNIHYLFQLIPFVKQLVDLCQLPYENIDERQQKEVDEWTDKNIKAVQETMRTSIIYFESATYLNRDFQTISANYITSTQQQTDEQKHYSQQNGHMFYQPQEISNGAQNGYSVGNQAYPTPRFNMP